MLLKPIIVLWLLCVSEFKSIHNPIRIFCSFNKYLQRISHETVEQACSFLKGIHRNEKVGFMVLIRHLFEECNGE